MVIQSTVAKTRYVRLLCFVCKHALFHHRCECDRKGIGRFRSSLADAFCFFVHSAISLFILLPQNLIFIYDFLHTELLKFFYTFEFNSN